MKKGGRLILTTANHIDIRKFRNGNSVTELFRPNKHRDGSNVRLFLSKYEVRDYIR